MPETDLAANRALAQQVTETAVSSAEEYAMDSTSAPNTRTAEHHPLRMPAEVWNSFSPDVKAVYERAQAVLDTLSEEAPISVRHIGLETKLSPSDILHAVQVLHALGLVAVRDEGPKIVVALLAIPLDHVSIPGPDGTDRWFFLARPLGKRELDRSRLN